MRILIVSLASLFVTFVSFLIVKLWGQSQVYYEYQHPFFTEKVLPVEFYKPSYEKLEQYLKNDSNIFLDVAVTLDQKLVSPKKAWVKSLKPLQYQNYSDIKNDVFLISDYKDYLKNKKIIFNISENAQAVHDIFFECMRQIGFEKGENFIVASPYEAPIKALKELAPALLYGSTQPEILKIVAMGSMHLYEAVNIRSDVIIHTLKLKNQDFFSDDLLKEIERRHKRIIIGPMNEAEKDEAAKFKPYGLIINI
jgi:hypothetical protein